MKIMFNIKYICLIILGNIVLYSLMKCDVIVFIESRNKVKIEYFNYKKVIGKIVICFEL